MKTFTNLVVTVMLVLSTTSVFASNLDLCVDNRKAGRGPQAEALCSDFTQKNPASATGWYEFGNTLLVNGKFAQAEEAYASAVKLSPTYAAKVGHFYKKIGYDFLKDGQIGNAQMAFNRFLDYQPQERKGLSDELYREGNKLIKQGLFGNEDGYLAIAGNLNFSLREPINQVYIKLGDEATDEKCLHFYTKAYNFSNGYDERIGRRLLKIVKLFSKIPGRESITAQARKTTELYLGSTTVNIEIPDTKVYTPGESHISLKAGEQTDHWITFEAGKMINYNLSSSDYGYKLVYDDGEIVQDGPNVTYPNKFHDKFKLVAITDQPNITFKVREGK